MRGYIIKDVGMRVIQLTDDEAPDPCPNPFVPYLFGVAMLGVLGGDETSIQARS
jgi:hypothetical protein